MYEPWMCVVTYVPPWACDARIACVCVHVRMCESEALLREMKDILKTWTAACVGGLWRLINIEVLFVVFFFFSFFGSSCMYEEYLHSLTRTITNGQNAGQAQPHPPCLCVTRHTS